MTEREQRGRVLERFTRTAQQFSRFSLSTRAAEAGILLRLAAPRGEEIALDLACGPGTFTRVFAAQVNFILGVDLTAALLEQARRAAAEEGLNNLAFACGDATALPLRDRSVDLAVCAYSFHHFGEPARALCELVRVVRKRGRIAVVDIIVPEDAAKAEANNRIERARDVSHTRTLPASEIRALVESAGFRLAICEIAERPRSFNDWMQTAGWKPGDAAYAETRRLMEASIADDAAGFHAVLARNEDDIHFVQTSFFLIAEKR